MTKKKTEQAEYEALLAKVHDATKQKGLDLSADEDLAIGIMNLISIEEHLFFTAQKTGKAVYLDLLREAREMRKELLKRIIKDYEGEVWCISKHLLAGSMRLMEVGTKQLGKHADDDAKRLFAQSHQLWSMFWGLNLGLLTEGDVTPAQHEELSTIGEQEEYGKMHARQATNSPERKSTGFLGRLGDVINDALDCCKE